MKSRLFFAVIGLLALGAGARSFAIEGDRHSQTVDNAAFTARIDDGWLTRWTNKRTGETIEFGAPQNASDLTGVYRPGAWFIPGYGQEKKAATWSLEAASPRSDTLVIQQQLDVPEGDAHSVQWSIRLPLDKIDGSYWPTGLTNRMLSKEAQTPDGAVGPSYYFGNRNAVISSHSWRQRYYVIQGKMGGLLVYVDDPGLDHFSVIEMDSAKFPAEVVLTNRSMASPPWSHRYQSSKWTVVQYDGWVNQAAQLVRDHLSSAYDVKPLSQRPTAWVQNLAWSYVRVPFTQPLLRFPDSSSPDYTQKWDENLKLADQWLENLSQVLEPDKVMLYVNWWRYYAHDTMFPEHSVDPFFALTVGKARQRGFHVMLHFHNHLVQDATTFYGRYVAKQDEWHRKAYPQRPNAVGDPEGKIPWGVGYDFVRRTEIVQRDKQFGTPSSARMGLPIKMTGYHMSPAYEGWRYMQVAEILSAVRATGADAIHIDVPAVWPEGKERYGINSQQGSREFFKLLRKTLDENGLSRVAIATEGTPGEGYMKYVDMAQLVRGSTTVSMLNGMMVDTMIELQLGDDLEKAKAVREAATARYPTTQGQQIKKQLRFDKDAVGVRLAKIRELGEPNVDEMVISPFVRAYPHLGSASPLMGGYDGDPAAAAHSLAAQALHTWATLQRDGTFSSGGSFQMFMDAPPWDTLPEIKAARKEAIKSGKRTEGKVFNSFSYGEFALARFWQKNQPRLAPLGEWQKGDVARYRLAGGATLTARRTSPVVLALAVNGNTLAEIDALQGWKNNEQLLKEYGPTFLLNQLDGAQAK